MLGFGCSFMRDCRSNVVVCIPLVLRVRVVMAGWVYCFCWCYRGLWCVGWWQRRCCGGGWALCVVCGFVTVFGRALVACVGGRPQWVAGVVVVMGSRLCIVVGLVG